MPLHSNHLVQMLEPYIWFKSLVVHKVLEKRVEGERTKYFKIEKCT